MKYIWYLLVIFFGLAAVYFLALSLQKAFLVPITGISHFVDGLVLIAVALKLKSKLVKINYHDLATKYFMWFFALFGIFQVFMGLPHLLLFKAAQYFPTSMAWAYIDGHFALYVAAGFIVMVPIQILAPGRKSLKYLAFVLLFGFGSVITVINIFKPNHPVFDQASGITLLNAESVVGMLIGILAIASILPPALVFIYNGIRYRHDRLVLIRSLLLGAGFILILVFGPLHDRATTALFYLIADLGTIFGFLTTAAGVFYGYEAGRDSVRAEAQTM